MSPAARPSSPDGIRTPVGAGARIRPAVVMRGASPPRPSSRTSPGRRRGMERAPRPTRVEAAKRREGMNRMRYVALACDYDGTLADRRPRRRGDDRRARARCASPAAGCSWSPGRELDDLPGRLPARSTCSTWSSPRTARCSTGRARAEERALAEPPPAGFVAALRARGVAPLSVGRGDRRHLGAARDRRCSRRSASSGSSCRSSSTRAR